jgi:hypothetical protein
MQFRVHFQWPDGTDDSIVVSGDDIDTMREHVAREMERRGVDMDTCWSEDLSE